MARPSVSRVNPNLKVAFRRGDISLKVVCFVTAQRSITNRMYQSGIELLDGNKVPGGDTNTPTLIVFRVRGNSPMVECFARLLKIPKYC